MLANLCVSKQAISQEAGLTSARMRYLSQTLTLLQAIINLAPHAPRFKADFEHSMNKTFTDCYFAKGFTGGGWGYALNSNDSDGRDVDIGADASQLEEKERRLAYYIIGWNTIAVGPNAIFLLCC
jgi:hypothetical protein